MVTQVESIPQVVKPFKRSVHTHTAVRGRWQMGDVKIVFAVPVQLEDDMPKAFMQLQPTKFVYMV